MKFFAKEIDIDKQGWGARAGEQSIFSGAGAFLNISVVPELELELQKFLLALAPVLVIANFNKNFLSYLEIK